MTSPSASETHFSPLLKHLTPIGAIAVLWAGIESMMEMTVLGLYEIDMERGLVFTAKMGFLDKFTLLQILTEEGAITDPALKAEMKLFFPRLQDAYGERNRTVHGVWGPGSQPGVARRMTIKAKGKTLQARSDDFTAEDLWDIADALAALARDFGDLSARLGIEDRLARAPKHSSNTLRNLT